MKRQPKYKNRKVIVDGIEFDSKKEANRWKELKLKEKLGLIKNLERQKKYVIIPAQYEITEDGKSRLAERECCYYADFAYNDYNGSPVIEDVKGYKRGQAYAIYTIKRKLMLQEYGIKITEI